MKSNPKINSVLEGLQGRINEGSSDGLKKLVASITSPIRTDRKELLNFYVRSFNLVPVGVGFVIHFEKTRNTLHTTYYAVKVGASKGSAKDWYILPNEFYDNTAGLMYILGFQGLKFVELMDKSDLAKIYKSIGRNTDGTIALNTYKGTDDTKRIQTLLHNVDISMLADMRSDKFSELVKAIMKVFDEVANGSYLRFLAVRSLYVFHKNDKGQWAMAMQMGMRKNLSYGDTYGTVSTFVELISKIAPASVKVIKTDDLDAVLGNKIEYKGVSDFANTTWQSSRGDLNLEIKCPARGGYYLSISSTLDGSLSDRTFPSTVLLVKYLNSIGASYMGRVL